MTRMDYLVASIACASAAGTCARMALGIDADAIFPDGYSWVWWVPAFGWFIPACKSLMAAIRGAQAS